jgi:hypothetical protein
MKADYVSLSRTMLELSYFSTFTPSINITSRYQVILAPVSLTPWVVGICVGASADSIAPVGR